MGRSVIIIYGFKSYRILIASSFWVLIYYYITTTTIILLAIKMPVINCTLPLIIPLNFSTGHLPKKRIYLCCLVNMYICTYLYAFMFVPPKAVENAFRFREYKLNAFETEIRLLLPQHTNVPQAASMVDDLLKHIHTHTHTRPMLVRYTLPHRWQNQFSTFFFFSANNAACIIARWHATMLAGSIRLGRRIAQFLSIFVAVRRYLLHLLTTHLPCTLST